jgi:hypothetical protein
MSARKRLNHSSDDFRAIAYALFNVLQSQNPLQDKIVRELYHTLREPFFVDESESELKYANLFWAQCRRSFTHYKGVDHRDPRETHWLHTSVFTVRSDTPHHVGIGSRSAFLHINDNLWVDRRSNADQAFYEPRKPSEPGIGYLVLVPNWAEFIVFLRCACAEIHTHL